MLRIIALLALAALCLPLAGRSDDAHSAPPAYDFSAVTNLILNTVNNQGLEGASLILVKDGQTIYEQYFGTYSASTVVPIASSTKWLSAGTFMTLVDDGIIGLDDPVSQYLPEWTGAMGAITMRQLWSITSGLVDHHPCMDDTTTTLANCVEQIRLAGLVAPPGSQFYYGGASMMVAGRVAEVATGQTWSQLYIERMRAPMGFTFTGYGFTANPLIPGGAFSHLHDYASLVQMYLDGGTHGSNVILTPRTVREMQKDQTFGVPIAYNPHPDGRRYGIGEWRDIVDGAGNAIQVSSQGKFGFSPWIDNQRGYVGVFLVEDLLFPDLYPVVELLEAIVRSELDAFDADGDGAQDAADTDDDNDGLTDAFERACGAASANASSTQPERTDGPYAGTDDDGDTQTDELLPGYSDAYDCDGDGWTGAQEQLIFSGTTAGDQDPCGENGWPSELVGNNNALNIADLNSFLAPSRPDDGHGAFNKFNHPLDDDGNTAIDAAMARYNLQTPPHEASTQINIGDLNALLTGAVGSGARPPMFGGAQAFYAGPCPWPP